MKNYMGVNWRLPGVTHGIDFSRNVRGLRGMPRRVLLLGHALAGSMEVGVLVRGVTSLADAVAQAGHGSMLAAMWMRAWACADRGLPIDMLAVAAPEDAQPASSLITVSLSSGTTVAQAGEVMYYAHGVRISAGVTVDDTDETVAQKLVAATVALAAVTPELQISAALEGDPGQFRVTALQAGEIGNQIDLRATYYDDDRMPSNVVLTIPAMTGGTLNPRLTDLLAAGVFGATPPGPDYEPPEMLTLEEAMTDYRATEIVCPWTDSANMLAIESLLEARWERANMQDGQVVKVVRGTAAEVQSWKATRKSRQGHTIPVLGDATNPWETAAMAGAGIESIAVSDPSMHYLGRPLVGYMGPRRGAGYSEDDRNALLGVGASPLMIAADGSATLGRMVVDYTHNASGAEDPSSRELPWVKFSSYYRWYTVAQFYLQYGSGWKLDPSATEPIPGVPIMTAALAVETMVGNYTQLIKAGFVQQDLQAYIDSVRAEIDAPNCLVLIEDEPKMLSPYYQTGITSFTVA